MDSDFSPPNLFRKTLYQEIFKRASIFYEPGNVGAVKGESEEKVLEAYDQTLYKIVESYVSANEKLSSLRLLFSKAEGKEKERLSLYYEGAVQEVSAWRKSLILFLDHYFPSTKQGHLKSQPRTVDYSPMALKALDELPGVPRIVIDRLINNLAQSDLEHDRPLFEGDTKTSLRYRVDTSTGEKYVIVYKHYDNVVEVSDIKYTGTGKENGGKENDDRH